MTAATGVPLGNFDARSVEPAKALEPLATGWYTVRIVGSEYKPNAAGTGAYLELEMEVISPAAFAGRKVWDRLNLQNTNPVAVEMAFGTLSAICHATGQLQVQNSAQLHGLPMMARVVLVPARTDKVSGQQYAESNDVKGYERPGSKPEAGTTGPGATGGFGPPNVPAAAPGGGFAPPAQAGLAPPGTGFAPPGYTPPAAAPEQAPPAAPAGPGGFQPPAAPAGPTGGPPPWAQ